MYGIVVNSATYYLTRDTSGRYSILKHIEKDWSWFYWENEDWRQCFIPGLGRVVVSDTDVNQFNIKIADFCEKYLAKD